MRGCRSLDAAPSWGVALRGVSGDVAEVGTRGERNGGADAEAAGIAVVREFGVETFDREVELAFCGYIIGGLGGARLEDRYCKDSRWF